MSDRVQVVKRDGVWTWSCVRCMWFCWTRLGFARALGEATNHRHWR